MCKTDLARHGRKADDGASGGIDAAAGFSGTESSQRLVESVLSVEGGRVQNASELWHIHGKRFDLSGFLKHHPGGSSILEAVRGAEDATALFESYHALANTAAIRQSLQKFEWTGKVLDDMSEREAALVGGAEKEPVRYRWDDTGFYAVLKSRVKRHFLEKHSQGGVDPRKASVNRFIKAPLLWYMKELFILAVYVLMFVYMLGYDMLRLGGASVSSWSRAGFAVLAGAVLQSFSFCTLHDASHYGLLFKRPGAQDVLSRVCNAWTLWHHGLWVMHHVYGHHSFTGDPERDPDLVHARPYLRKSVLSPKEQYDPFLVRWQRFLAPLFMMVLPGATLGQTQAYVRAARVGHLWQVSITEASGGTRWYEYLTYVLAVGSHFLVGNFWVSFCYFMGISVAYHLCIAPDHDTFESSIVNSIEAKREERRQERAAAAAAASPERMQGSGSRSDGRGAGAEAAQAQAHERRGADAQEINRGANAQGINRGAAGGERAPMTGGQVSKGVDGGSMQWSLHAGQQRVEGVDEEEWDDWGEVQVRHSGNFSNGNFFVTQAMGGINYQIEHHLFPSMSHMLYEEIAPIVRETCREFCIPYNAHPTLWSAYKSYLKHLVHCSDVASTP